MEEECGKEVSVGNKGLPRVSAQERRVEPERLGHTQSREGHSIILATLESGKVGNVKFVFWIICRVILRVG